MSSVCQNMLYHTNTLGYKVRPLSVGILQTLSKRMFGGLFSEINGSQQT